MTGYDAVVVGARVAGASTALLLARGGARVALVDRGRRGSDALSTLGLMRAGVLQLSRWQLMEPLVAAGTPPIRATVFHYPDGEQVHVSVRPSVGVDALYAPRRSILDALLVDAAEACGVDVFHRTKVTSMSYDGRGRVRGVNACDSRGVSRELVATMTVGADGLRSVVAEQVGAPVRRQDRNASAVMYRYFDSLPTAGYEWGYGVGAAAGLIPTNGGDTCAFVSTTPARMRSLRRTGGDDAYWSLLAAAVPEFRERARCAGPPTSIRGWAGHAGTVRQSWGPGWALVGDAGHYKDPITAHGMTDALRDAELLANQLLAVWGGCVPESIALATYQSTRDRLSRQLLDATDQVAGYDWNGDRIRLLLRQLSSSMSDEVDHLQALPERPCGSVDAGTIAPDRAGVRR